MSMHCRHVCKHVPCSVSLCMGRGMTKCIHTCTARLDLPLTWLWDFVTPTGIRVDFKLDTGTQTDHTQIRGPWS